MSAQEHGSDVWGCRGREERAGGGRGGTWASMRARKWMSLGYLKECYKQKKHVKAKEAPMVGAIE